ncbi:MAG: NAD(+)/NADH kinase [Actinomycetota bacterium]|nr:NAD(+)/NADH kinase [Actinomycetota bacterium]
MNAVAIVAHHERHEAVELIRRAIKWLDEHDHEAWVHADDASPLGLTDVAAARSLGGADLVLSLGGDGTMLRTVRLLDGAPVPILGVKLGWLGYLTELEPPELTSGLERFFNGPDEGRWVLDDRLMLDVTLNGGDGGSWRALNEAVVEKHESGHTVRLLAIIDGEPFTTYAADGLIVATPTGSTAYSLSARGPVVSPRHRAVLLTPVSPHMLFDRTLVLDPSETVDIEVLGHRHAELAVDGVHAVTLSGGDVVRCVPSAATARFVRMTERHYHQILKAKFGLKDH